ncbi:hypothetical protein V565_093830 [Rhizoctonia solani 123E]|uniref:Uncharacterized protein n=1 Tax=Rhizoctonia solani 123E TaxID=1423351 RepID=A0A074RRT9_9AGAM|nr:hypothetical protein V565_093830 [Rhizoctonia solani 123E]
MQDDLTYYKQRTVQITAKDPRGVIPEEQSLRSSLASFGDIRHFQSFSTRDPGFSAGSPNTAIVVFHCQAAVKHALDSSRSESDESFWRTASVKAHPLKKSGPVYEAYLTKIVPKLKQESQALSSGLNEPPGSCESKLGLLGSEDCGPPLKRPRAENWGTAPDGSTTSSGSHTSTSKLSRTPSTIPDSPEWMRARITQLEAELSAARAARDMSISEHDILRAAHEAEQRARREAMLQKSAAETALSQAEVEQGRLRTALEATLSVQLAHSNSTGTLSGYEGKPLQQHSEEAPNRVQELSSERSVVGQQKTKSDTTELDEARVTIQRLKSEVATANDQLWSSQLSLELLERRHSSSLEQHDSTRDELEAYKLRLENEQTHMKKLKERLIPEVYRSLGATHETLGAFLSAMGEPPASDPKSS